MRILHVLNSADPENGGTVQAVSGIARSQSELGHEVTVVSTGEPEKTPEGDPGVRWRICPVRSRLWRWSPTLSTVLSALIKEMDIVHLHTMWDFPVSEGYRLSRHFEKPYLVSPHGMLDRWSLSQRAFKKKIYLMIVAGHILKHAGAVHFTSLGEYRNSVLTDKAEKAFICPLGVDLLFKEAGDANKFYESYPALKGRKIVLFLGRLHSQKRPELVIESFKEIAGRFESVTLVMAGPADESYLRRLKTKVSQLNLGNRVVFTGLLNRSQVAAVLRISEVLVSPSFLESFGLSVAEAMAASCAVIVTPGVNLSDDVQAASAGIVCQPIRDKLSEAISKILLDKSLRQQMGQNGRELILKKFQWAESAKTTIQIYENVLSGRRTSAAWVTP